MSLVAGKTDLASGSGTWKISVPPGDTIAVDDPAVENMISLVQLTIDLKSNAPQTMTFSGPPAPNPADSIGYTTFMQVNIINDTGAPLKSVALDLKAVDPHLPFALLPGVVEFGTHVNANYPYFTDIQTVAGQPIALTSPDNQPTTATGPAASRLTLTGGLAKDASLNASFILHNTELATGSNNFTMTVLPA